MTNKWKIFWTLRITVHTNNCCSLVRLLVSEPSMVLIFLRDDTVVAIEVIGMKWSQISQFLNQRYNMWDYIRSRGIQYQLLWYMSVCFLLEHKGQCKILSILLHQDKNKISIKKFITFHRAFRLLALDRWNGGCNFGMYSYAPLKRYGFKPNLYTKILSPQTSLT